MSPVQRKAYEVSEREVSRFFKSTPHHLLLNSPLETISPDYQYLVRVYRNAWQTFSVPRPFDSFNVVLRFHFSILNELGDPCLEAERALKQKAFSRLHQLCLQYRIAHPELSFGLRGTTAGTADENRVRLNLKLFTENVDEFLSETIPHELCHVWHGQLGLPGKPHGNEWKNLMRRMGVHPRVCHRMDVSRSRVRTKRIHAYSCRCS